MTTETDVEKLEPGDRLVFNEDENVRVNFGAGNAAHVTLDKVVKLIAKQEGTNVVVSFDAVGGRDDAGERDSGGH